MRGYKGFNADMTCRGFQYEVGKTYTTDDKNVSCRHGFYFCPRMADVFNYYDREGCRYAEVEAFGKIAEDGDKCITDKIGIVRELTRPEVFEIMYAQEGLDFKDSPFPADEIIKARKTGTLDGILPSGTEFTMRFSNGERNVLVVGRDKNHTYLITKYLMTEKFAMNRYWINEDRWSAYGMRKHVQEIYNMLPENIRKTVIPMHIRYIAQDKVIKYKPRAFLLSAANVFGNDAWNSEADCDDSQIDIFREPVNRIKKLPGASSASWWWLRSTYSDNYFNIVRADNSNTSFNVHAGGVTVGFCIETRVRTYGSPYLVSRLAGLQKRMSDILSWIKENI